METVTVPRTAREAAKIAAHARVERVKRELREAVEPLEPDPDRIVSLGRELRSAYWTLRRDRPDVEEAR